MKTAQITNSDRLAIAAVNLEAVRGDEVANHAIDLLDSQVLRMFLGRLVRRIRQAESTEDAVDELGQYLAIMTLAEKRLPRC